MKRFCLRFNSVCSDWHQNLPLCLPPNVCTYNCNLHLPQHCFRFLHHMIQTKLSCDWKTVRGSLFRSQGWGHPTRYAISQRRNFELFIPHFLSVSQGQIGQRPLSFCFLDFNTRTPPKPILCNMYNSHNKHRSEHTSIYFRTSTKRISWQVICGFYGSFSASSSSLLFNDATSC